MHHDASALYIYMLDVLGKVPDMCLFFLPFSLHSQNVWCFTLPGIVVFVNNC